MNEWRRAQVALVMGALLASPSFADQSRGGPASNGRPSEGGQGQIEKPGAKFNNIDVQGKIQDASPDSVKVTFDPKDGHAGSDSTIAIKDKGGKREAGLVDIKGVDSGDSVTINGNNAHEVDIFGSGGHVQNFNESASGVIHNSPTSDTDITFVDHKGNEHVIEPGEDFAFPPPPCACEEHAATRA